MPLVELIDLGSDNSAGYKFDLFDEASRAVVKVFVTQEAVLHAVGLVPDRNFIDLFSEAASAKFDRGEFEDDGLVLVTKDDLPT